MCTRTRPLEVLDGTASEMGVTHGENDIFIHGT